MTPLFERNQNSSLEDIETIDIDLPSLSEVAVDAQVAFSLIPLPLSCPTMYGTIPFGIAACTVFLGDCSPR